MDKKEAYKRIKIAGMLSFIPFVLAAGVLAGYMAGDYLEKKLHGGPLVVSLGVAFGIAVSILEVVRIIKLTLTISHND